MNNAAWVARSDLLATDAAFFDKMMAINVRAPLLLIRAALPHLKESQGCVLNIGSINAYSGEGNLLAYSISKGALMTLSRNLADALCYDGHARQSFQRRLGAHAERVSVKDQRRLASRIGPSTSTRSMRRRAASCRRRKSPPRPSTG